ncbi:MAG: hypothetical protein ACK4IX_08260, partial [Candidatus Sericytochromatia bacterium]
TASPNPKTGDGGLSTDAKLKEPCGIAIDSQDNIYIVEGIHNTIRKVDAASGIITTVAGNGVGGYSGDGAQATLANLNTPQGVSVDSSGNLYIADTLNNRLRKVDTSGVISTIAGNSNSCSISASGTVATNACLGQIMNVSFDSSNNMYMPSMSAHLVWKLDSSDNKVYRVAGTGVLGVTGDGGLATAARLSLPSHVMFDNNNNKLYIADSGNNKFRVVTFSDGKISRFAGPSSTASGDNGEGAIVPGATNSSVRFNLIEVSPASATINNIGGSVTLDSSGNIYLSDRFNNKIKRVTASDSRIRRYVDYMLPDAGNLEPATKAQLFYPTAIARGRDNYIYFSDRNNEIIRRIDTDTGIIENFAGTVSTPCKITLAPNFCGDGLPYTDPSVGFNNPQDMIIDSIGNLYISDRYNQMVRKITKSTGIISRIAGLSTGIAGYGGDGGPATNAQLNNPSAVALDKYGALHIIDRDNHRIRRIDPITGIITTVVGSGLQGFSGDGGPATDAKLNQPYEIAFDVNDNMFIADRTNKRVRRVDAVTGIITTYAGDGRTCKSTVPAVPYPCGDGGQATDASFNEPVNLAIDSIGNLYILDKLDYRIRKIDTNTGKISTVLGTGSWG